MSDVIEFKPKSVSKQFGSFEIDVSDPAQKVRDRILSCGESLKTTGSCSCMYCNYMDHAAEMIRDIVKQDMINFANKTGAEFATFDEKAIYVRAMKLVKDYERSLLGN